MVSPKRVFGASTFTVTFEALFDRGRPSDGWTAAFGYTTLAASDTPGRLENVPATCTSTLGIRYVASPLNCVLKGSACRQYGLIGLARPPVGMPGSAPTLSSGTCD